MENKVKVLRFISGGYLGDFIHCLFVVKQYCEMANCLAEVFITDDHSFGGDIFRNGLENTYRELVPIVCGQSYIHSFQIYNGQYQSNELLNLNIFRQHTNLYGTTWTKIMCDRFMLPLPKSYPWLQFAPRDSYFENKVVIHRSDKDVRYNPNFNWNVLFEQEKELVLIGSKREYDVFPFKDKVEYIENKELGQTFTIINSCKKFVGNQSSPFAIASALDVQRVLEVSPLESNFYLGESEFSDKISFNFS